MGLAIPGEQRDEDGVALTPGGGGALPRLAALEDASSASGPHSGTSPSAPLLLRSVQRDPLSLPSSPGFTHLSPCFGGPC